jgi:hypothetical protein
LQVPEDAGVIAGRLGPRTAALARSEYRHLDHGQTRLLI